ncbi:hypothetical protein HGI30_19980 [Paenibacillus albicereus]|uniref:Uncharacterized protein n=1 Tax=Paenibacillus albicereus TaxID=2726185 RepID=A0A6H2H2E1_9BACL|nr:hypothetical protein [Paenibacillus albicereus]QJC53586.1 hypothetical protein HGI30_19980 [Paenibacillus albicereus]
MRRMLFERPTEDYDRRLLELDARLCGLIGERKRIAGAQPGFPPAEDLSAWAEANDVQEDYLNALFAFLRTDDEAFRPVIEPEGYRRMIVLGQTVVKGETVYTLSSIRQFGNASVISLVGDDDPVPLKACPPGERDGWFHGELRVEGPYRVRFEGGGSSGHSMMWRYVVTPALPDEAPGQRFLFRPRRPGSGEAAATVEEIVFTR